MDFHAAGGIDQPRHVAHQRRIAARVIQQWHPQGHQQQPAKRRAAGRQHQAFPDRQPVPAGAPFHQPPPGHGGGKCGHERHQREAGFEAGRQPRHVRRRPRRNAGLHGDPDHPDGQGAAAEEQQREPVDQGGDAALERRQGEGGERRQRREAQQQRPVRAQGEQRCAQRHQQEPQRHSHMAAAQLEPPAPQRPQRERPGWPAEPDQKFRHAWPISVQHARIDPPAPQVQRPGQPRGHQGRRRNQAGPVPPLLARAWIGGPIQQARHHAADAEQQRHPRRAAQRQADQPEQHRTRCKDGAQRQRGNPEQRERAEAELGQRRRGLVRQLGQAEAGDQGQQAAVGDCARVVGWFRFATEGESQRLGLRAARQEIDAVPGGKQGQRQQQDEGDAGREIRRHPGRRRLHRPGAEPIGQQPVEFRRLAQQAGRQPWRRPGGQLRHVAEGGDVGVFPGFPADEAGQHVGHAEQQQGDPRQAPDGTLGNDGWSRLVHCGRIMGRACFANEKGQHGCPGCPSDRGRKAAGYLAAVFSASSVFSALAASSALAPAGLPNFLKNLSTRPPMSLTDFWVPV